MHERSPFLAMGFSCAVRISGRWDDADLRRMPDIDLVSS